MKRFVFPLEKALEIRGLRKLLAEEKLGETRREENRTRERLNAAYGMRDRCFEEMREAMGDALDPHELRHLVRYGSAVEDEIVRQRSDLTRREAATRDAVAVVVDRTKEERTLERYRENRLREYRASYWWEQGKVLDEVGSQRFTRERRR